ncbi:MAG: coproporphyrinogen-III oxidase family protein [Pseudomonadota bacterium]|jgi:oxygen-independent coproporphyrinogen-3 oxidase
MNPSDFANARRPASTDKKSKIRNPEIRTSILNSRTTALSIYLHIPFCLRLCPYCHFYRIPEIPAWKDYLSAVAGEIESLDLPAERKIFTLYVGGGTPTLMPPDFYNSLINIMGRSADIFGLVEATIETDGTPVENVLEGYARAGFDRISVGVKSFDTQIREILGAGPLPGHDPVAQARRAGFSSVGLDLIYGIGGQDMDGFISDLNHVIRLGPDHVSLYMLEGPEIGNPKEGDPDLAAAMFRESARILRAEGYRQYEITNFARPGGQSLHNTVYWKDGDYIGLGPSAHSAMTFDGVRIRWRNRPDVEAYLTDPRTCREELSRESGIDRAREALILGLRMTEGVYRPGFTLRYGIDPLELLGHHARDLSDLGLIRYSANKVRLTTRGMLLSNEVFVKVLT